MATGVGKGETVTTSSNSLDLKIGWLVQTVRNYLSWGPSYSQFCPKIRCHGNRGWQEIFRWHRRIAWARK